MNPSFHDVITANDAERRDLFLGTAARLGTAVQNVKKDFWVCWTLDALFNGLAVGGPGTRYRDTRHVHADAQRDDAGCAR